MNLKNDIIGAETPKTIHMIDVYLNHPFVNDIDDSRLLKISLFNIKEVHRNHMKQMILDDNH